MKHATLYSNLLYALREKREREKGGGGERIFDGFGFSADRNLNFCVLGTAPRKLIGKSAWADL